ncbi:MAG: YwmB family TATA-box binding protein [Thermaerobacter sp.]|nr:YwmB family TATA-box binding protein [Thermaerobacter sp.]
MRGALVLAAFLFLVTPGVTPQVGATAPPPRLLQRAWRASGARPVSSSYSAWAVVDHRYHGLRGLTAWGAALAGGLEPGLRLRQRVRGEGYRRVVYTGATARLVLESFDLEPALGLPPETYLTVDFTPSGRLGVSIGERRVAAPFRGLAKPHVFVRLEGYLPGRRSAAADRRLVRRVLRAAGACRVEGVAAGTHAAVYGYGPDLGPPVTVAGRPIDLQLDLRYDPGRGATRVVLGTPLGARVPREA